MRQKSRLADTCAHAHTQWWHSRLSTRPTSFSLSSHGFISPNRRVLYFKALSLSLFLSLSVSPSLLRFFWLIDLKWQIRLVVSLCDVTPSLADRQPAVTCWETLCRCQKLCAPLQWLIPPCPPPLSGGEAAGRAAGVWLPVRLHVCVCVSTPTCVRNQCIEQVRLHCEEVCEFAYKYSTQVED